MVSLIVPLDLSRRPLQLIRRIVNLSNFVAKYEYIELVIGLACRHSIYESLLFSLTRTNKNVKIIMVDSDDSICNSQLRNHAVKNATHEYIILFDADLYPDINIFNHMYREARDKHISMVPCIYLTNVGTKMLIKYNDVAKMVKLYLHYELNYFKHIASPSSAICITKESYISIGGFDELYIGYGYEDFDFLIRYCLLYRLIDNNGDLLIDQTYITPLYAKGFRASLGCLSLDNLLGEKILFHQYHSKNKNEEYYVLRKKNRDRFLLKMKNIINLKKNNDQNLLAFFFHRCQSLGLGYKKFSILFISYR